MGLRNRYCAGDPEPGGAPGGRVSGSRLVGSDAALPPKAAAFSAPVCGKAVRGKNQRKRLNRSGQGAGRWSGCSSRPDRPAGLSFLICKMRATMLCKQNARPAVLRAWLRRVPGGRAERVPARRGWWQQGRGQGDHRQTRTIWQRAAGPGRGRRAPTAGIGGLGSFYPVDPKRILS